jgi:cytochrome c oxidase assembly protein subunit 15
MALFAAVLMLATITLSAFMRLSQAGVGCEPWPGCYAQAARDAAQGVATPVVAGHGVAAARLAHRVVASLVLILAIAMVLSTWLTKPALPREGWLAAAVLALAVGLAVLGIVTPGARVPAVTLGNLLGGFLMLALCGRLAAPVQTHSAPLGAWAVAGAGVVTLQVVLGALVSGSMAALSCNGLSDCMSAAQAGGWPWQALNPWQLPVLDTSARVNPAGALTQWLHRVGALIVLPMLALLGALAWQRGRRRAAGALLLLVALQTVTGLLASSGGLPIAGVLLHNLFAALSLALLVRLA